MGQQLCWNQVQWNQQQGQAQSNRQAGCNIHLSEALPCFLLCHLLMPLGRMWMVEAGASIVHCYSIVWSVYNAISL